MVSAVKRTLERDSSTNDISLVTLLVIDMQLTTLPVTTCFLFGEKLVAIVQFTIFCLNMS